MAFMKNSIKNMSKWVGVRPAHLGEQTLMWATIENGTSIIFTVTVGTTLFISSWWCAYDHTGAANWVSLSIRDGADVLWKYLFRNRVPNPSNGHLSGCFPIPLEVPAGYDIIVISSALGSYVSGGFHGIAETLLLPDV